VAQTTVFAESAVEMERPTADMTAAQVAYLRLKEMITTLALAPGSTVQEGELQQQLGVGRTPLREALHRLSHEHMLHIYPRRAVVVAKLGFKEIAQIFELRLTLEATAASLAAQRLTQDEITTLRTLGMDLHASRARLDIVHFLRCDHAFHRAIAQYACNDYLTEYVDHVLTLNLWLWHTYFATHRVRGADLLPHEDIIAALAQGNAATAEALMREHVLQSKGQLLTQL